MCRAHSHASRCRGECVLLWQSLRSQGARGAGLHLSSRCPLSSQQVGALPLTGLEDFSYCATFLKEWMYIYVFKGPFTNFFKLHFLWFYFYLPYFWLCWPSLLCGLLPSRSEVPASLAAAPRPLNAGSGVVAHGHSCPEARGVFPDRTRVFSISSWILFFTAESPGKPSYLILKNVINLKMS